MYFNAKKYEREHLLVFNHVEFCDYKYQYLFVKKINPVSKLDRKGVIIAESDCSYNFLSAKVTQVNSESFIKIKTWTQWDLPLVHKWYRRWIQMMLVRERNLLKLNKSNVFELFCDVRPSKKHSYSAYIKILLLWIHIAKLSLPRYPKAI